MRPLMPAHTASSTHWPSWSQAPSWWGSPKSPSGDRAVDGRHDLAEGDQARLPGQDVAAADAALRAHDAGALEGQEDLLEVRLGEPGALGDVAHRRGAGLVGVERERQQRPARVVAPRRHLHDGDCTAGHYRLDALGAASCPTTPSSPPTTRGCITNVVPALLHPHEGDARLAAAGAASRPTGWCCSSSTGSGWNQLAGPPPPHAHPGRPRRRRRSPRWRRAPPPPRSPRSPPACRRASTA